MFPKEWEFLGLYHHHPSTTAMDLALWRQSSRTLLWRPVRLTFSSPRGLGGNKNPSSYRVHTKCHMSQDPENKRQFDRSLGQTYCSVGPEQGDLLLFNGMVFQVVMYGCESWTVKKAELWRFDAFEVWYWRRLLRVPWTARRSNQSILKEISPGISLEGMMLKLKLQ